MSRANETVFPMIAYSRNASTGEVMQYQYLPSLTIREYFAGLALEGLLANSENNRFADPKTSDFAKDYIADAAIGAHYAVTMADALIAELAKPVQP